MIQVLIDSLPDGDDKTLAIQQEKVYPFILAVRNGKVEDVKKILDTDIDKDLNGLVKDSNGDNALDVARKQRNNSRREKKTWNEIIQVLINSLPDGDAKILEIEKERAVLEEETREQLRFNEKIKGKSLFSGEKLVAISLGVLCLALLVHLGIHIFTHKE